MKPSPERLSLSAYPFVRTLNTRQTDVDSQRHLNNAALALIYEDARARLHFQLMESGDPLAGGRLVAARVVITYLGEGFYPDDVTVGCAIVEIGRTSHVIGEALFQNGACIGTADVTLVYCLSDRPTVMPDPLRAQLEEYRLLK